MKRKICGVLICMLLTAASLVFAPGAKAADPRDIVRIKLSMGNITTTPVFIDGNYTLAEDVTVALPRQLYTIKKESTKLSLYYSNTLLYTGNTITLIQNEASEGLNNFVWLNNAVHGSCAYLGDLHFDLSGGYIRVINYIYLEEYLYGVVPYEMSNSWPRSALEAQAVCARTYAVINMKASGSNDYDMVDTTANQTYHGYVPSYQNAIDAVNGTAKQLLISEGVEVATYYSASNGGQIDIPQHIWSYSSQIKPYHVIKDDPFDVANPYSKEETLVFPKVFSDTSTVEYQSDTYMIHESSVTQAQADLLAQNALRYFKLSSLPSVAAAGYIAQVTGDIEVVGVSSITPHTHEGNHGGVYSGSTVLYDGNDYNDRNDCRSFEKATVSMTVRANKFVPDADYVMLGDVNGDGSISIIDYTMMRLDILGLSRLTEKQRRAADINADGSVSIIDYTKARLHILNLTPIQQNPPGSLVKETVTVSFEIDLHELDKTDGLYKSFFSSNLRLFAVEETETSWNIYQRRFGHGIGMSQRGAQQMASTINPETGNLYTGLEILEFYFPNTTISTLDIEKPAMTVNALAPNLGATNATVKNTVTYSAPLNVRSAPNTSNAAIGQLPPGARIEVTDDFCTADWHKINYGGVTAYVYASYITLDVVE